MDAAAARVLVTRAAAELLLYLQKCHGPLVFHQSGSDGDGSSPICRPAGEFLVGDSDVLLGTLGVTSDRQPFGVPVWMSVPQLESWQHTQLVIDAESGRSSGFSLEAAKGMRFVSRDRTVVESEKAASLPNRGAARARSSGMNSPDHRRVQHLSD